VPAKAGIVCHSVFSILSSVLTNKPNSPIVQMNASLFTTMIYTIYASLTKVKNKPNQTQIKPNANPIPERPEMNLSTYFTSKYNNKTAFRRKKTNPIQTQFHKIFELIFVFKTIHCGQNYGKTTKFENKLFLTKGYIIWYR